MTDASAVLLVEKSDTSVAYRQRGSDSKSDVSFSVTFDDLVRTSEGVDVVPAHSVLERIGDLLSRRRQEADGARPMSGGLPYIHRRDRVQDERSGVTFYHRDETRDRGEEFVPALEEESGEDVYVADAREAALEAAFRNPELAAAVLRECGYDFE